MLRGSVDRNTETGIQDEGMEEQIDLPSELDEDDIFEFGTPGNIVGDRLGKSAADADRVEVAPAGLFRVYLGAAPGVGKTCAMLDEGARRRERGSDVVVGFVETHGRARTAALMNGLECIPKKTVEYRGKLLEEMDVETILARSPRLALVDELAHTNVPGSGVHEKRWQDVLQMIEAGIAVITTVNIQHLESIADAVEQIIGIKVRERVPDWVVRRADQIELVDSSAEQLRRRMLHGNIYPKERVPLALSHFFKRENLIALRELALRFVADETEEEMLAYLKTRGGGLAWDTAERIMVGVTAAPGSEDVLRRAARMAARSKAELHAVHVVPADGLRRDEDRMAELRKLALDLGGTWNDLHGDNPAMIMVEFAKENQITQIVMGSTSRGRLEEMRRGSIIRSLLKEAGNNDIDIHIIARKSH
ncbi:MAG: universal stress protein [Acidimicrobiales bacterium]